MTRAGSCTWNAIVLSNAGCGRRFAIARSAACGAFPCGGSMCEAGEDTDYYKKPVFLTPVKEGPFYALKVGPALLTVTGGLKTDINFECLDADGKPIEGLYALGNCMGDITAVDYPINVAGNSHGRCITYGYLLGKDLAK